LPLLQAVNDAVTIKLPTMLMKIFIEMSPLTNAAVRHILRAAKKYDAGAPFITLRAAQDGTNAHSRPDLGDY
jgi:hypothetical protein